MKRKPKIEFYQDKAGKHRWRIVASNGQTIAASSQGYRTLVDSKLNLQRIRDALVGATDEITTWSKWKKNDTGDVPAGIGTRCQVRFRDGVIETDDPLVFVWSLAYTPSPNDIVEYRHAAK